MESPAPEPAPAPLTGPSTGDLIDDLHRRYQDLRTLFFAFCAVVMVLVLAVDLFIARQWRSMTYQLDDQRLLAARVAAEFKAREPRVRGFVARLHQFAATNAAFRPVLEKYRPGLEAYYPPAVSSQKPAAKAPAQ